MIEPRWYFGYQCMISKDDVVGDWHGEVVVPCCHPVRSKGFEDCLVLLIGGSWRVFTDGMSTSGEVWEEVLNIAIGLLAMQVTWDSLSPYEREYIVW